MQQQRRCRDRAEADGVTIPRDLEFSDEAVSGTKRKRVGLNALLQAAKAGRFGTLYLDSLSRLARESVITMPILKDLVHVFGIRVVVVSESIDTDDPNWEVLANAIGWHHQHMIKTLAANVLRGDEHAILSGYSIGDWPYGYASEPVPGTEQSRGRAGKPRKRVVIQEEHAAWVRRIFTWFVDEGRTLDWITRELTRQEVPKPHRATTRPWQRQIVRRILKNAKYVGVWKWGQTKTCREPSSGDVFRELRPEKEYSKWTREMTNLRIVEDAIFAQAQLRLDQQASAVEKNRQGNGLLGGSAPGTSSPRHLLQRLLTCSACGRHFQVLGSSGKYLGCAGYKVGACTVRTQLPRALAQEVILKAVRDRLLKNPAWVEEVFRSCLKAWHARRQDCDEVGQLEKKRARVAKGIARLLDTLEGDQEPDAETSLRLKARRTEAKELEYRLALAKATQLPTAEPTREWVRAELTRLESHLIVVGKKANDALRNLLGGNIVLSEACEPGRKRRHFVGRCKPNISFLCEGAPACEQEVVLTFRHESGWECLSDPAKELFDQGLPTREIAARLKCPYPWVAKALAHWHRLRGVPIPDGRKLRGRLDKKTKALALADRAWELHQTGMLLKAIASELQCDTTTARSALRHGARQRNQTLPDGRTRRKQLRLAQAVPGPTKASRRKPSCEEKAPDPDSAAGGTLV